MSKKKDLKTIFNKIKTTATISYVGEIKTLVLPDRFIHQSVRYCIGRMSYAVHECCDWLIANWDLIPQFEKNIIMKDIDEEFGRNERWVKDKPNSKISPLGHSCDMEDWKRVRSLWKKEEGCSCGLNLDFGDNDDDDGDGCHGRRERDCHGRS